MNKLFTKIVGVALGLTMAIGVGVAVGSNSEAVPVHAAGNSYVKVTSAPSDWSGTYLLVYESSTTAGVAWTGVDAASCNVAVTISSGEISSKPDTAVELEIATMTGGYSIKVVGGNNNGKFIKGTSGSNTIGFDSNAQLNTISYDSTNKSVLITSNTSVMRYNSASNNYRFRYFKSSSYSSQKIVQLYKKEAATKTLSSIALSGTYPTSFYTGDTFSHSGMTVTATYDDKTTADVTSSATFSGYNMSTAGNQTVTVSYTEGGTMKSATYGITVTAAPTAESAEVINDMTTKTYVEGTAYDVTGLTLRITYDNDDTRDFDFAEDLTKDTDYVLDHDNAVLGDTSLDITGEYLGCEFDFTVTGITVTAAPKVATYTIGGSNTSPTVTPSGLVPTGTTATWSNTYNGSNIGQDTNGNSQTLTISGFSKGTIITGIKLYMHSNKSDGAGYASYQVGSGSETALVGTIGSATIFKEWGDNTSYGTAWRDVTLGSSYSINVPASSTFKIKIACVTTNSLYCIGFTINYAYANPTFTVAPLSHSIFTSELAESTVTVANFDTDPTLEYAITSGASYISDVEIGSYSNHVATVLIEADSTNFGTAVVRIRDKNNPTTYYADITVEVKEIPTYEIDLSISTDTGTEYGYVGDAVTVTVTTSRLQGTGIIWSVTSGNVDPTTIVYDDTGYAAEANMAGTLTIKAQDNGNASNFATASVTIVKRLNPVMAPSITPYSSVLTFTAKYSEGGEQVNGSSSNIWTVSSDGSESNWESANGIHFGTSSAYVQYVQLNTSSIATGANDNIKSIIVNTQDRATTKGQLTVSVGGHAFKHEGAESVTVTGGAANYTFTGNGTGEIVVKVDRGSSQQKAIYVLSVTVNYVTEGAASDIANADNMHNAQNAVIDYAADFNADLDDICIAYGSTDVDDLTEAWNSLAQQYVNWFNNGGKSLSSDEIAYAKSLFANASSDSDGDDLQVMLSQYDWIVGHYDVADFLADDPGTDRPAAVSSYIAPAFVIVNSTDIIPIIVIASLISVSAIGGYFFIRRRKEQ